MGDKDKGPSSMKEMFHEWVENSAVDGLSNILRSREVWKKIMWIFMFLFCIGYMIQQCYQLVTNYLDFPVNTLLTLSFSPKLVFPAVTLCNLNAIKKSKLSNLSTSDIKDLLEPEAPPNSTAKPPKGATANNEARTESRKQFSKLWAQTKHKDQIAAGHELSSLILSCTYNGGTCNLKHWFQFHNHVYGNCYVFNSGWDGHQLESTRSGPRYGLSMEIFIEQYEYIADLTETAGARLMILDQNQMPFPEDQGIDVAPGFLTQIGVRRTHLARQPAPYPSKCIELDREQSQQYNMYSTRFNVTYSTEACYKTCLQRSVISRCRCGDPSYPFKNSITALKATWTELQTKFPNDNITERPCVNNKEDKCLTESNDAYARGDITCDCPLPCKQDDFLSSSSFSKWPSDAYQKTIYETLAMNGDPEVNNIIQGKNGRKSDPSGNILKVIIYYDELNYQSIAETEAYSVITLLADIGGQIGFWVGLSILSMFELVELLMDVFRFGFLWCCNSGKMKKPSSVGSQELTKVSPGVTHKQSITSYNNDAYYIPRVRGPSEYKTSQPF